MAGSFFQRLRGDIRGQALAELALAVPILALLLFGILEFSRHYYTRLSIRHAVAEAARFHATGQALPNPDDPDGDPFETRAASIEHAIESRAAELHLTVNDIQVSVIGGGSGGGEGDDAGEEGDVVQIQADLTFDFVTGPLLHALDLPFVDFTVVTTYKNEPRF